MATIEFIQKRIAGKKAEIEKLEKKLARIRKVEAAGWDDDYNPYMYDQSDLRHTLRDLEEAKAGLEKWREELAAAEEKANSRNVPAILEFLEAWKVRCKEFYAKGLTEFYEEKAALYQLAHKVESLGWVNPERKAAEDAYETAYKAFRAKQRGYYERWEAERDGRIYRGERKVRDGEYEYLKPYCNERTYEAAMAKLSKDLDEEANRKYDFIIERTNAIVGEITDASNLHVGSKDDLNGYIVGTRGIAKVQTIGAGGYNIQCFHFRTLIHKGY